MRNIGLGLEIQGTLVITLKCNKATKVFILKKNLIKDLLYINKLNTLIEVTSIIKINIIL